ncbi:hypothetical protein [Hahella sp. HN01]|uniref:hypothetical protein n=1 Tax=Hahella sp. HN01 TaxID=2847262 RepID=UPI001C1F138D|nr:hypothetical protein [Hahella sp. HN01]MBU6955976.1 hypothetical protein [Hahella sp. HN01]
MSKHLSLKFKDEDVKVYDEWYRDYVRIIAPLTPAEYLHSNMSMSQFGDVIDTLNMWYFAFKRKMLNGSDLVGYSGRNIDTRMCNIALILSLGRAQTYLDIGCEKAEEEEEIRALFESFAIFVNSNRVLVSCSYLNEVENEVCENLQEWNDFVECVETGRHFTIDKWEYVERVNCRSELKRFTQFGSCYLVMGESLERMRQLDKRYKNYISEKVGLISENGEVLYPKSEYWWYYSCPKFVEVE